MNSVLNSICEGLLRKRVSESKDIEYLICSKSRELQKLLSDALSKKYGSILKDYPNAHLSVDVYTTDVNVEDIITIDNSLYEVDIIVEFDSAITEKQGKQLGELLSKKMGYKKNVFIFYEKDSQLFCELDGSDDIEDLVDDLSKVNSRILKICSRKTYNDIEAEIQALEDEWKDEKREEKSAYNRARY